LDKGVKSSSPPASVERALFGDPDYTHDNQDGKNHLWIHHPQVKKAAPKYSQLNSNIIAQTKSEEGTFSVALVTNGKLTSQRRAEA
jgi:hypothetical protein